MHNYKLMIQYDGSRYRGWQKLGEGEDTIQKKLEKVVSELAAEDTEVIGCSRTDAGVHALAQTANVKLKSPIPPQQLKEYMNRYLPKDISVTEAMSVSEDFHSRYNAKSKTYLYQIWNREFGNPFLRKYSLHVTEPLNRAAMARAAGYFIGEHDFTTFSNAKTKKKSMVRSIYSIDIQEEEGILKLRIKGNGFLYNMVRKMVGVLVEVGLGRMQPEDIPELLQSRDRSRITVLAEACGLFLEQIVY